MKRTQLWIDIIISGIFILVLAAGYCWYVASFSNLHVVFAEEEDLNLFPEIGKRIELCLHIMMGVIFVLFFTTSFLLLRAKKSAISRSQV